MIDAVSPRSRPAAATGLAVAFSGGLDSTVLLHALIRAGHDLPLRAVHVCHHMQADAEAWAAHCQTFCSRHDIAVERLDVRVEAGGQGMEAAARDARYTAFAATTRPGELLALAHHADDQAETFLLQGLRGAGVAGLSAMPAVADFAGGRLWRPLLGLPRTELRAYALEMQLSWVDDPSNRDSGIERGYLREAVWPVLTERWPSASTTLSRAARWCAQASDTLVRIAAEDTARLVDVHQRLAVAGLGDLDAFRQSGVLRHWLASAGCDSPDHRHVEQIRRLLTAREHAGPRVRWRDTEVRLFDGHLYALPALAPPPPGQWHCEWALDHALTLPDGCGVLKASFGHTAPGGPGVTATVAFRRGGERFPDDAHVSGSRSLKSFLHTARIPPWVRQRLPLIYLGDRLVAVADYWLDRSAVQRLGVPDLHIAWCESPPGAVVQTGALG